MEENKEKNNHIEKYQIETLHTRNYSYFVEKSKFPIEGLMNKKENEL